MIGPVEPAVAGPSKDSGKAKRDAKGKAQESTVDEVEYVDATEAEWVLRQRMIREQVAKKRVKLEYITAELTALEALLE